MGYELWLPPHHWTVIASDVNAVPVGATVLFGEGTVSVDSSVWKDGCVYHSNGDCLTRPAELAFVISRDDGTPKATVTYSPVQSRASSEPAPAPGIQPMAVKDGASPVAAKAFSGKTKDPQRRPNPPGSWTAEEGA